MSDKTVKLYMRRHPVETYILSKDDSFMIDGVLKERVGGEVIELEADAARQLMRIQETAQKAQEALNEAYMQGPGTPTELGRRTWEQSNLPPEYVARATAEAQREETPVVLGGGLKPVSGPVGKTPTPKAAIAALLSEEVPALAGGLKRNGFNGFTLS